MKKLKKLTFYKTIWFWVTICLLVYILRQSKVTIVKMFIDIVSYVFQQVISEPIAFLAFLISIITVYIERINVLKTDRRAKLSISYKIEEMSKVKGVFKGVFKGEKKEIEVPKLRIYENSGTIKSYYMFTPYIKNNDVKNDTIDDNYFSFNAVHIHLNENSNFFNPARLHYNNCIAPNSFISNNPNENQSHFIFCLFEGVDGSYKLLLLVYLKNENGNYDLQVIDRVDALNKGAAYLQHYYNQFKKCEKYLSENNIIIS